MPTMTFLTVPNGSLAYRDSAGTGTLAGSSPTYATSSFTGAQGVVIGASTAINLASVATAANPALGSAIVRVKTPTGTTGYRPILTIETISTYMMRLRLEPGNGVFLAGSAGSGFVYEINSGVVAGQGAVLTVYGEWNGNQLAVAVGNGAKVAGTWASGGSVTVPFATTATLKLGYAVTDSPLSGGQIDGAAIFDGPLTDAQRTYLATTTTPWTWGMALSAPIAGYIDVLPSAGANTGAPVLTLP